MGKDQQMVTKDQYNEKKKVVYPNAEEELIDFLNRCKLKNSEVMLCPRCSAIFDKEAAKSIEGYVPHAKRKGKWPDNRPRFDFKQGDLPYKTIPSTSRHQKRQVRSFVPAANSPVERWVHSDGRVGGRSAKGNTHSPLNLAKHHGESSKFNYNNNYKGKNPMTRTQWCRYQRQKKATMIGKDGKSNNTTIAVKDKGKAVVVEESRKPTTERIFSPLSVVKGKTFDFDMDEDLDSDFDDSSAYLNIICNVVSILPSEYDVISEANEVEEDFTEEMASHKPMCYYVMNNGCVEEQLAMFERPDGGMQNHLKPLDVQAKVDGVGINKVFVDGGAVVNLMPQFLLKKIGKFDTDLKSHNVVLNNYEGKTSQSLGAIEVDLIVGTVKRTTLFLVIASKANFNLLLGREWIHGVGAIPSTLHQRLVKWKEGGLVENVEADQSYFLAEVNHITKVFKHQFVPSPIILIFSISTVPSPTCDFVRPLSSI